MLYSKTEDQVNFETIGSDRLKQVEEPPSDFGGILGKDREIVDDRKLIMTDLALDTWIGAHYGISLDNIP